VNSEKLNAEFGIPGILMFIEGPGGLVQAHINNPQGEAIVSTYASQVLSFKPAGAAQDLLFLSDAAYYLQGKATKGGVPVCWPWFGPDPEGKGRAAHGFVRNRQWQVISTAQLEGGETQIVLGVDSDADTKEIWPADFELRAEIRVGRTLEISLVTRNLGNAPLSITQGLHTYFSVGDAAQSQVLGLEGCRYIDKLDGGAEKQQTGAVTINGEVDRIYLDVAGDLTLIDAVLNRRINISHEGSNSAVVWNPWIDTTASMADLQNDDYKFMLCVETTNAGPDKVEIAAGGEYRLSASYSLNSI
jgi:glucose-6-phosphate 1-epimerase